MVACACNPITLGGQDRRITWAQEFKTRAGQQSKTPPLQKKSIIIIFETDSCSVTQAGFKLLGSSDPPVLASQSAGIADTSHLTWPTKYFQPTVETYSSEKRFLSKYYCSLIIHLVTQDLWWRCTRKLLLFLCLLTQHPFCGPGIKEQFGLSSLIICEIYFIRL